MRAAFPDRSKPHVCLAVLLRRPLVVFRAFNDANRFLRESVPRVFLQ
ncbi:hypothetical protein ZOD2009_21217 [Haladaptatus paucihalophilus DX253]|uniref:Uncharacterized protein n=1 Tax=Haladaptatus paucihalophilus DX253 TaxID=797209 RepID=E7QZN4_HALPU|nr:hypothetical protein ZOD2009_21217 [Haladaptatus paucihalophilus DX253]